MTYRSYMQRCAAEYFAALMVKYDGCVRAVAAEAGVTRQNLYRTLQRHGLIKPTVYGNAEWRALQ